MMNIQTKRWLIIIFVALTIGMICILFFSRYVTKSKQSEQAPIIENDPSSEQLPVSSLKAAKMGLPDGFKILFDNTPGCGVIKNHIEERYSYDFFCQDKVIGFVNMIGNWRTEHFLSYEGSNELIGFFRAGAGEGKKYYWGPTILYKMNTNEKTVKKFLDVSSLVLPSDTKSLSSVWGSKYFITDVSKDGTKAVYCNYFDVNTLFVRDMVTGNIQEFKVDKNLYDFGDASFSDDGTQIAFAGVKRKIVKSKDLGFIEAQLFVLDTRSGKIITKETSKNPGMYSVNGWNGQDVSFEYLVAEKVIVK
jgi:hypothetical protein